MSRGKSAKGSAIKQIEMRRCTACRQVRHKSELMRVVKTAGGNISLDTTGKVEGRGAYVCKSIECATILGKRRNLDRVFKVKVPDELYEAIKEKILM